MTDPQANYLSNTAPELQERFVGVLKSMTAFSQLSDSQLLQLFRYSKFVKLADQDRVIRQGDFDQIVYILIQGRLQVFMELDSGEEERLDVIFKPFVDGCTPGRPDQAVIAYYASSLTGHQESAGDRSARHRYRR